MDILDEDVLSLWKNLNNNNVSYLMIGGIANVHYKMSDTFGHSLVEKFY